MKFIKSFFTGFSRGFKSFGEMIANFFNFIILTIVYILGIGATSVAAKIFGKHFLRMKSVKANSYWEERAESSNNLEDYRNQF